MEVNRSQQVSSILFEEFTMFVFTLKPLKHESRESGFGNLRVTLH